MPKYNMPRNNVGLVGVVGSRCKCHDGNQWVKKPGLNREQCTPKQQGAMKCEWKGKKVRV